MFARIQAVYRPDDDIGQDSSFQILISFPVRSELF